MNTSNWKSLLAYAVIENDFTSLAEHLSSGADIDQPSYFRGHGEAPLLTAIRYARYDMVWTLLDHGADVNLASSRGHTPLLRAAQRNYYSMLGDLLQHGADINATDTTGRSALFWAVKLRNFDAVRELVKHGAEVNSQSHAATISSVLHLSADSTEIARYLMGIGADVNAVDDSGETPLFSAVRVDNIQNVRMLLDNGAIVNAVNQDLRSPLHLASASVNNSVAVAQLLLDKGSFVNILDRYLSTPLVLTLRSYILQPNYLVARCLIQHGSDLQYELCATALEWTAGSHLDVLKFAVEAGFRLIKAPWVQELLSKPAQSRPWHLMAQHEEQQKNEVIHYIQAQLKAPRSLSDLSRIAIREHLINVGPGYSIFRSIRCLPLPEPLKIFLMMINDSPT